MSGQDACLAFVRETLGTALVSVCSCVVAIIGTEVL